MDLIEAVPVTSILRSLSRQEIPTTSLNPTVTLTVMCKTMFLHVTLLKSTGHTLAKKHKFNISYAAVTLKSDHGHQRWNESINLKDCHLAIFEKSHLKMKAKDQR